MDHIDKIIQTVNVPERQDEPTKELEIKATDVFAENQKSKGRITVNEGGLRSSKTYSIAQLFIMLLFGPEENIVIEVVRKTMPALRATAMKDFFGLLREYGLYNEANHNKTENTYRVRSNEITFYSVDDEQKVRGRSRDYLWINEANELEHEDFKQLNLRTRKRIFMDFNPVDEDHWLFTDVMSRPDVVYIHSDYRDNLFLEPDIVKEIERLQEGDPNYWAVFGLGKRPASGSKIYTHYELVDDLPENPDEIIGGLDFGFNVPTALVRIGIKEISHTWDELIYQTNLTNRQLFFEMNRLREAGLLNSYMPIYADAAEPDRIQELCDGMTDDSGNFIEGFNVLPADKAVSPGIDFVKSHPMKITKRSTNILNEIKKYMWKVGKDGKIVKDEPVKINDHAMDAGRYGEFTFGKVGSQGGPNIRNL